jgi:hypothetical protein
MLPSLACVAAELATHCVGYRVLIAAIDRANSQALGALEDVVARKFRELIYSKYGSLVLIQVIRRSSAPGHSQDDRYADALLTWNFFDLERLVNSEFGSEVLVELLRACEATKRRNLMINMWLKFPLHQVIHSGAAIALFGRICSLMDDWIFFEIANKEFVY